MDKTTERLATFATSIRYEDLTPAAIRATGRLVLDAIGCAIGAYDSEPAQIARRLAKRSSGTPPARVWGSGELSSVEAAAFANGVMVRYLDFNDTYMSKEASHPSDMLAAILAVADAQKVSGKRALLAIASAYEIEMTLADSCNLFDRGYDYGFYIGLGAVAGIGQLLDLSREQMGNAIALVCTPNVPTRQTRSGALSMWKGCAAAAAGRSAIFAAELAKEGMSGPSEAFEGRHGVWDQVTGKFDLEPFGGNGRPFAVERCGIKLLPAEYNSQLPLYLILQLRKKVSVEEIESVHVETYRFTYTEIGSEPEKWRPTTRETADHSLPYMLAAALSDGDITVASFDEERIRDPKLPELMDRIKISENVEFTRKYPESMECRIEIKTKKGEQFVEAGSYPKGHGKNPMSDAEVEEKFWKLCQPKVSQEQGKALIEAVYNLETMSDVGDLIGLIRVEGR